MKSVFKMSYSLDVPGEIISYLYKSALLGIYNDKFTLRYESTHKRVLGFVLNCGKV